MCRYKDTIGNIPTFKDLKNYGEEKIYSQIATIEGKR